jgi:hypothetical protein
MHVSTHHALSMSEVMATNVSDLFRDVDAEKKLVEIMQGNPAGIWNVSQFVRDTRLTRTRVDRAVIALEAEHLIKADVVGKSKVIRFTPDRDVGPDHARTVEGNGATSARNRKT